MYLNSWKEAPKQLTLIITLCSKPFVLWQIYFPKVFKEKGGFDVVIGNPPYKLCQPSNTDAYTLNYFKKNYKVASYKIDLFHLFFEKGIDLLTSNGNLCYITPNTYLTNKFIKPLRKYILDNCTIRELINYDKVFESASVDTATILLSKNHCQNNKVKIMQSLNFKFTEICRKDQIDWVNDKDNIFNINLDTIIKSTNCQNLGIICKTYFGIQAYDKKSSISNNKISDAYLPMIDGSDIRPYEYAKPKIYFHYLPEKIKSGGDWNVYVKERIVVRQIGQIPIVGLCKEKILTSNTIYNIYPKDNQYKTKFILACLNSSYIKNYWQSKYYDNKALFPKIKGFQLKELPIPIVNLNTQDKVINFVNKIITAKKNEIETSSLEKSLDSLIYSLYNLTEEEIKTIEESSNN